MRYEIGQYEDQTVRAPDSLVHRVAHKVNDVARGTLFAALDLARDTYRAISWNADSSGHAVRGFHRSRSS